MAGRRRGRRALFGCDRCGHDAEDHVRLPGHPDGAEECHGDEDCDCCGFRPGPEAV